MARIAEFENFSHDAAPSLSETVTSASSSEDLDFCITDYSAIYHKDLIQSVCQNLKNISSKPVNVDNIQFKFDSVDNLDSVILKAHEDYDCVSEASSALLSVTDLNDEDISKLIAAVHTSESRKSSTAQIIKDPESEVIFPAKFDSAKSKEKQEMVSIKGKPDKAPEKLPPVMMEESRQETDLSSFSKIEIIPAARHLIDPFFKFNLPTNLELLKDINPLAYLEKYCWICDSRISYYQRIYARYRDKENIITMSKLFLLLNDLLANTLTEIQFHSLCLVLQFNENTTIETNQVFCVCAVAERMFFKINLAIDGNDGAAINKEFQERIDFANVIYKLRNYSIKSSLLNLFKVL